MGDISAEPSMEEILSSIKRIMAEEGDGPIRSRRPQRPVAAATVPHDAASHDPARDEDDGEGDSILELDVPIAPAPVMATPVMVPPAPPVAAPPEPRAEQQDEPLPPAPPPPPEPEAVEAEPIVSDRATAASRQAIDQLTRTLHAAPPAPAPAGPTADASLEGLVREMLRPMLRDWLDARLPAIVEQHVAAEIARITGGR